MPLPFLLAAWGLGALAASGAGSGAVGLHRRGTARDIDAAARQTHASAKALYTSSLRKTERSAIALGERKIDLMSHEMKALHRALSMSRRLDFVPDAETDRLPESPFSPAEFEVIDFKEWERVAKLTVWAAALAGKA